MAAYRRNEMDDAFRALADPSRRLLLDSLNERNGQTLRELCSGLDMARQSVSKHLAVLEAANLVTTVRRGREKLHYLNPRRSTRSASAGSTATTRARVDALADLKRALEDTTMDNAVVRLHDLHQDHPRTTLAGPHRPGLHPALLGRDLRLGLAGGLDDGLAAARRHDRRSRARSCSSPTPTGGSPTAGTVHARARRVARADRRGCASGSRPSRGRR